MKHRIIYVVVRVHLESGTSVVLDSFASYEACKDKADEFAQLFKDKNIDGFIFEPQTSMFYEL